MPPLATDRCGVAVECATNLLWSGSEEGVAVLGPERVPWLPCEEGEALALGVTRRVADPLEGVAHKHVLGTQAKT